MKASKTEPPFLLESDDNYHFLLISSYEILISNKDRYTDIQQRREKERLHDEEAKSVAGDRGRND